MARHYDEDKRCSECIHESACQAWAVGTLRNANASACINYESLKESNAYFIGYRDGARDAEKVREKGRGNESGNDKN